MIDYWREKLAEAMPDIKALIAEQWAETGTAGIECDPLWPLYEAIDRTGNLILVLARDKKRAVGYIAGACHMHVNSRHTKVASLPTYYVEKRPDRAFIMRRLFEAGIVTARDNGAKIVKIDTEPGHSAARLLEAMHFQPDRIGYMKMLEG